MSIQQHLDLLNGELAWIGARLKDGLQLLHLASSYAAFYHEDSLQLAVELDSLRKHGLNECDLRWLWSQKLISHLIEQTLPGDAVRSFRNAGATLSPSSCFLLTSDGVEFANALLALSDSEESKTEMPQPIELHQPLEPIGRSKPHTAHPTWNSDRQELWHRGLLIKQFRIPSPNQVAVLSAFEEEGWPSRIDDPLPPRPDQDPKRRLNDTIRNLNRSQKNHVVRFVGDGSGQGVLWEPIGRSNPTH